MTLTDAKDIGAILVQLITVVVVPYMGWTMRRVEKNTNSISERNESIARKLGVQQGKEQEQADQKGREDDHKA